MNCTINICFLIVLGDSDQRLGGQAETRSRPCHVDHMQTMLALNSETDCLFLQNSGIKRVCHHTWLRLQLLVSGIKSKSAYFKLRAKSIIFPSRIPFSDCSILKVPAAFPPQECQCPLEGTKTLWFTLDLPQR